MRTYDAVEDPYCYRGTTVLKNLFNIRDQETLDTFETAVTFLRSDEPFPAGRFSIAHYRATHHHLFQDLYEWAGKFRTVRISKDGSAFCYPENIAREMKDLFGSLRKKRNLQNLSRDIFAAGATSFLSTLNAIHPFREGNGRAQMSFLMFLADRAGHPFDLEKLEPEEFLEAMVASFKGNDDPLERNILALTAP